MQHLFKSRFVLPLLLVAAFSFAGCSTTGPDLAVNIRNAGINAAGTAVLKDAGRILGSVATSLLFQAAQGEATGKKVDYLSSAAQGVYSQLSSSTVISAYGDVVSAYSAGKLAQTAKQAQLAAAAGLSNGNAPAVVANAVASVLHTAAGTPPAKS